MSELAPPIYVRLEGSPRLGIIERVLALAISVGCLAILITAAMIEPDPRGVGTHEQLGMQPCQFIERTGLPCAGCGMTTSFAHFVRGQFVQSFVAQPFAMVLAIAACVGFWAGLYCAITGKASHRLLKLIPMKAHLLFWLPFGLFGWAWKMVWVISSRG